MSENRRDELIKVIRAAQYNTQGLVIRDDQRVADAVIAWIDRAGVVAEEPERGPSAQDLLDAIYDADFNNENHSVRFGYILEQLERLKGKR